MTKTLKKTISSIIAFSLLCGTIPGVKLTTVQADEQEKELVQISEPGEFDDAAIYTDGSIVAFNKEKAGTKVSTYDNSKKVFNEVNTYDFNEWYYGTRSIILENIVITKDGKTGFLNKSGSITIEPQYDYVEQGIAGKALYRAQIAGKRGYINDRNEEIVPIKYNHVSYIGNNKFLTQLNGKSTIYDSINKSETSLNYHYVTSFSHTDKFLRIHSEDNKLGVSDLSGNLIIPATNYNLEANDDNTFLAEDENGSWILLDAKGELLKDFGSEYVLINAFTNGLARVYINGKWGLINKSGDQIIEPIYLSISDHSKGFVTVKGDNYLQGLFATNGNKILKQEYNEIITDRADNYIIAGNANNKKGIYDYSGNQIIPSEYHYIGDFNNGFASVSINDKYGLIDKTNKLIVDIDNDNLEIAGNTVKIANDGKMTLYKIVDKEEPKVPDKEEPKVPDKEEPKVPDKEEDSKLEKLEEKQIGDVKISLFAKPGVVEEGTVVEISPIEDKSIKNTIKLSLGDEYGNYVAYDINLLKDNVKIQPNGEITLSISIPDGFDKDRLAVYRIEDNGTKTKMNGSVVDGNYQFNVDHFSVYVLAEATENEDAIIPTDNETNNDQKVTDTNTTTENKTTDESANAKKEVNDNKDNEIPKTGDNTSIGFFAMLFFLAVSSLTFIVIKNKRTQA
ncbi:WG repeat-containing protein [Alkalibaculum bacchi]|uniref:WG repeat-containing protein n=1 Tax=Alkalibaculum bacchi TaxID=645887 RepID=UPI0026F0B8BC|nr:WG repeat-containing protein [Alkalibaculum bacchi]